MASASSLSTNTSFAIGIDFGTTFCCVAVLRHHSKKPEIIQSTYAKNTTPSYVAYNVDSDSDQDLDKDSDEDDDGFFAGEGAKQEAHENPENTIFDIKRLIGRSFYDHRIKRYKQLWPFHLVNITGLVGVQIGDQEILPQVIASKLIRYLKKTCEDYLGSPITSAVVTIPVYYNDMQRDLTRGAFEAAGLTSAHFIAEPVAAAVAYGLKSTAEEHAMKTCLIYDLGGGTFDVTVFQLDSQNQVEIKATGGDDRLGGEDFNDLLTEYCIKEFQRVHGVNLAEGKTSNDVEVRKKTAKKLRRIRNECEVQKCYLALLSSVVISLDRAHGVIDLQVTVTRSIFEDLIEAHLTRSITILDKTLKKSGFKKQEIDDVILIGGSSRIPKVQKMVQEYFEGKEIRRSIDVDEAVACGAAIHAYNVFKEKNAPFSIVTLIEAIQWPMEKFPLRSNHTAVAVGKTIYSFGGYNYFGHPTYSRDGPLDVIVCNAEQLGMGWSLLSIENNESNPNQRYWHSAVTYQEFVFIFGGRDTKKDKTSNSTYCFNTKTLKWDKPKVSGNIPDARFGHSAVVIKKEMIIFGGTGSGKELTNDLYALHLESFHWSIIEINGIPPSPLRFHHSATVYKDRFMLIFGGYDYTENYRVNTIMSFDFNSKLWTGVKTSGTPPQSRWRHSAFIHNGLMYTFGGEGKSYFNNLFSYHPETFDWKEVIPAGQTPSPRVGEGLVTLNDQVFIFGGESCPYKYLDDTTCIFKI